MNTSLNRRAVVLTASMLIAAAGQAVQAQETWSGGGADNNSSTDGNWLDGTAPVGGAVGGTLTFDTDAGFPSPNIDVSLTGITGLLFNNDGTDSYVIGTANSSSLTFAGPASITNNSSVTQTINTDIIVGGGDLTIDSSTGNLVFGGGSLDNGGNGILVIGASNTTINNDISGAGGVTQSGAGTLTLGGNNTYTGTTTVSNGTLDLTGTMGGDSNISVTGGTMNVTGTGSITGNGTVTVNGGTFTTAVGSSITGNGDFTLTTGTMTLNGNVDGGNNIDVDGGTFTLGSAAVISAGGTLDVTGGAATLNGDITGATNIDVSGGTLTIGAASEISGNGTYTQSNGTANLAGTISGDGAITLNGGTFTVLSGGGTSGDNAFTINTGATLAINAGGAVSTGADFNFAGGDLTLNGSLTTTGGTTTIGAAANATTGSGTLNIDGSTLELNAGGDFGGSAALNLVSGTANIDGTYSSTGDITMTGGTLNVNATGDIGNAGASDPNVTINGGTFNLLASGEITGAGVVSVNNDATATFTGNIGGDLNINGNGVNTTDNGDATVIVDGTIGGNLNNYSTNLTGTGTVTGTFTNWADGSFDAAGSGTIGTFNVGEDFVLNANADLAIDINKDAGNVITSDQIIAGDDVQLAPNSTITVNDLGGGGTWAVGDTIVFATAADANPGETTDTVIDGVNVIDTFDFLDFTVNINGTDIELVLAAANNFSTAASPLFQSMASAMDNDAVTAAGDFLTYLTALNALGTDAEKAAAIVASSPLGTVSVADASVAMTQRQATVNTDYLYARRNGFPAPSGYASQNQGPTDMRFASMAMDTDSMAAAIRNAQPGRLGTSTQRQPTGISTVPKQSTMQAYGNFFTLFSDQDTRPGYAGYSADAFGGQFGIDGEISKDLLLGLMIGLSDTQVDYATGGDADIESFRIGPYLSWEPQQNLYVDASLTYGSHSHDSTRQVSFTGFTGLATSSFDADDISASVKVGYEVQAADFNYMPFVSLNYTRYESDAYTETGGGGAALSVGSRDTESLEGQIGVRLSAVYQRTGSATFVPEGYIAFGDQFKDPESIEATFVGGSTQFTTNPADADSSILYGVGTSMLINSGMSAFIRYDGETSDDGDLHAFSGGVNIRF